MDNRTKKVIYLIGAIAALYIFLAYLLPFLLKLFGFVIGAIFTIIIWAIIGIAALFLLVYIIMIIRE
jgi:membrane protease YdiL (CAAX protease family)